MSWRRQEGWVGEFREFGISDFAARGVAMPAEGNAASGKGEP
jgi:hypothetical protein